VTYKPDMEAPGVEPIDLDEALEGQDDEKLRTTVRAVRERLSFATARDTPWPPSFVLLVHVPPLGPPDARPVVRGGQWPVDEVERALLRFDVDGAGKLRRRHPDDLQWRLEQLAEEQRRWLAGITPEAYEAMPRHAQRFVHSSRMALAELDFQLRARKEEL
jgi:hypothetical protein